MCLRSICLVMTQLTQCTKDLSVKCSTQNVCKYISMYKIFVWQSIHSKCLLNTCLSFTEVNMFAKYMS